MIKRFSSHTLLLLIALLWVVIFGWFIIYYERTLQSGVEVVLATEPIDPRDLLRGDYVILNYTISRFSTSLYDLPPRIRVGTGLYISLTPQDGVSEITAVSLAPPATLPYIRGTVRAVSGDSVTVDYGIESYFVPEGEGKVLEQARGEQLRVRVSLSPNGKALIKELLLNGQVVSF